MAISVEVHRKFDNSVVPSRYSRSIIIVFRVVIVNSRGERVLDTLIRIDDPMMIMVKPGKRQAILETGNTRGPEL